MSTAVCFELGGRTVPACVSLLHKCPQSFSPLCAQVSWCYCQSHRPAVTFLITLHSYVAQPHTHTFACPSGWRLKQNPATPHVSKHPSQNILFSFRWYLNWAVSSIAANRWECARLCVYVCVCVCASWPGRGPGTLYGGRVSLCDFTDAELSSACCCLTPELRLSLLPQLDNSPAAVNHPVGPAVKTSCRVTGCVEEGGVC